MYLAPRTKGQKNKREGGEGENNNGTVLDSPFYSTSLTETFSVTSGRVKDVAKKMTGLHERFSVSRFGERFSSV